MLWYHGDSIKRIIVDTSSILFGLSQKNDIFEAVKEKYPDHEIMISSGIVKELQKLASTKKKNARDAKAALLIIPQKQIRVAKDDRMADKWIIEEAAREGCIVCTNDSELRKRLRSEGITALTLTIGGQLR